MSEESGYRYDVFISYPHGEDDKEIANWVTKIFLDYFKQCLMNSSFGRSPEVYLDMEANQPGDKWKLKLREAIGRSRILVAIWSINYFKSAYCRGECAVMLHRERELGYWEQGRKGSLIVPVQLWDGETYPSVAREFHQLLCEKYSSVRKNTKSHDELKRVIKKWVPDVAERIKCTPPWNSAWLSSEWIDDPIQAAEESKALWPPNEIYHLQSMGWDTGDDDG